MLECCASKTLRKETRLGESDVVKLEGRGACVPVCLLAVGVFALYQVRTLQGNACKQAPGSAVGKDGSRAAERHVCLHVPGGRARKEIQTFISG